MSARDRLTRWLQARWQPLVAAVAALVVAGLLAASLVTEQRAEGATGLDRLATDTVVTAIEVIVLTVAASTVGGMILGLLEGRFIHRFRGGPVGADLEQREERYARDTEAAIQRLNQTTQYQQKELDVLRGAIDALGPRLQALEAAPQREDER